MLLQLVASSLGHGQQREDLALKVHRHTGEAPLFDAIALGQTAEHIDDLPHGAAEGPLEPLGEGAEGPARIFEDLAGHLPDRGLFALHLAPLLARGRG